MVALATLSVWQGVLAAGSLPSPDLILTNGKIYTGESASPLAQAVGVQGDRIVFVGSDAQAKALMGRAKVIDLHGDFVMPGMIDAHTHPGTVSILGSGNEKEIGRASCRERV